MKKILLLSLVCLTFIFATACSNQKEDTSFNATINFNGSSSLAPVMASLGNSFMEEYVTWDKVDPTFPSEKIKIYVASAGSGVGVNSVLDKTADFGMVSRNVKDSEKEKMEFYKEYVIAADALTVCINRENPLSEIITGMSKDEISSIFSGKITNWNEIDSTLDSNEIAVYIRDLSGGAYEVFQKSVMGDLEILDNATQSPSMGALGTSIANNPNGIGYVSYGIYQQNKDKLIALEVDSIAPTDETIIDGSYSIQRPLLFISNNEVISDTQKAFIDYVLSDKGITAIEENGYIPTI